MQTLPLCYLHLVAASCSYRLVHKMVLTLCNLHWWCFSFHQTAQILHLHSWWSSQLALVVFFLRALAHLLMRILQLALCGGGIIYIYYIYHRTVQVTRAQVRYLRQWVEGKTPPAQVTMGETTMCASGVFVPSAEGETPPP